MAQYAGQMLPTGNVNATGPLWLPANGALLDTVHNLSTHHGNFHRRIGHLSGVVGIGRLRLPNSPGWVVLADDNPSGPTLDASTPTAANPPTAPPNTITIAAVISPQAPGPVAVSGVKTSGATVRAAPLIGTVAGTYVTMTVSGTTWNGNVTMVVGTNVRIRAQLNAARYIYTDSNAFTVA